MSVGNQSNSANGSSMTWRHKLYYKYVRGNLPKSWRYALRNFRGKVKSFAHRDKWPIMESAAQNKPKDWQGWPDGKQFGFVLTHDVEGTQGVERCLQTADLEQKYGFVSSFNFIPEGVGENAYPFPREVIDELRLRGFEVGVHDLHHNGTLFESRESFMKSAPKINSYLSAWGAEGFRAGQMFHNLDWMRDLDMKYDLSTYDTDPFEPLRDDMGTIWPFAVKSEKGNLDFIEMPYTLPQDSTLFLVLHQRDNSVWKKKLEWIAKNEGMALLNVHPDYLGFEKQKGKFKDNEFDAKLYEDFLAHVSRDYQGRFWNGTPIELTRYLNGLGFGEKA